MSSHFYSSIKSACQSEICLSVFMFDPVLHDMGQNCLVSFLKLVNLFFASSVIVLGLKRIVWHI